jgi:hypothetical protein
MFHVTFTFIVTQHLYINYPRKLNYFNSHAINLLLCTYICYQMTHHSECHTTHYYWCFDELSNCCFQNTWITHFQHKWLSQQSLCLLYMKVLWTKRLTTYQTWIRTPTTMEAVICYNSAIFNGRFIYTYNKFKALNTICFIRMLYWLNK